MKQLSAGVVALMLLVPAIAQQPREVPNKAYYLEKSSKQRTAAWVLVGTGTVLLIGGVAGLLHNTDLLRTDNTLEAMMLVAGVPLVLASLPLFARAEKNKEKAEALVTPVWEPIRLHGNTVRRAPGIGIRIRF